MIKEEIKKGRFILFIIYLFVREGWTKEGLAFFVLLFSFVFFFFRPVCLSRGCKNRVTCSHFVFSFLVIHFFHRSIFGVFIYEIAYFVGILAILN